MQTTTLAAVFALEFTHALRLACSRGVEVLFGWSLPLQPGELRLAVAIGAIISMTINLSLSFS